MTSIMNQVVTRLIDSPTDTQTDSFSSIIKDATKSATEHLTSNELTTSSYNENDVFLEDDMSVSIPPEIQPFLYGIAGAMIGGAVFKLPGLVGGALLGFGIGAINYANSEIEKSIDFDNQR